MTDTQTLQLAAEARAKGRWLYHRQLDIWFTPDEVERSVWQGETWAVAMPLELASRPMPGRPADTPKPKPETTDTVDTMFLDLLLAWGVITLVGYWVAVLMREVAR